MAQTKKTFWGFPSQIKYIVGNEACERFSYYGMRSILVIFMTQYLFMDAAKSKGVFHLFISANYFLPLIGGYLSDRYLGKYRTILYLSIVYCIGHAVLAIWETELGMYWGLGLIAVGAGGIKPCVSAHVGDQFTKSNAHLVSKVFEVFYWAINFGSFFASLLIPFILPVYGPGVAFGIPGVLMAIATFVFWLGRKEFVHVPPSGKENSSQFAGVVTYALLHAKEKAEGQTWLDVARKKYNETRVEGAKAAIAVFKVFATVAVFWALFDQTGSTWVLQAEQMDLNVWGFELYPSQLQAANPIMVLILIPLFSRVLYPWVESRGIKVTPLRKMGVGMAMTGLSFVASGVFQLFLDGGVQISVAWQLLAYLILTAAEVLVSITGLEFAYTQAPRAMKSTIMSFWLLTVAVGNFLTAFVSYINRFQGAAEFFFYAGLMFVVAIVFVVSTTRYQERSYLEPDDMSPNLA